jgi:hypothetical protein
MVVPPADPRDPFQLDRLAEELASRELSPHAETSAHDLPVYVPLSHSNPYITAPTFIVEDFLISRSHTSLPDLRSELRDYLGSLKEELVKLINDDYEAFISLSTDLRDEGARLEKLKYPLVMLRNEILVCLSCLPESVEGVVYISCRRRRVNCRSSKMQYKTSSRSGLSCERRRCRYPSYALLHYANDNASGPSTPPAQNIGVCDAS